METTNKRPASAQEVFRDMNLESLHQRQQHSSPSSSLLSNSSTTTTNTATKNKKLFPQKLWDLINDEKYNFCLCWSEDGQLVYLNRDEFEDSYLKTCANQFHTQKAISFVRQMNMYGFRKVDDCYYENDNFKRDCKHLLKNMVRKHSNKNTSNGNEKGTDANCANQQFPFYRDTSHTSPSVLQSTTAAVAATILAQPNVNQNYVDSCTGNHGLNYSLSRSGLVNEIEANKQNSTSKIQGNHSLENHERLNEDSLSSEEEYCCSAGSSQGEPLANVLGRLDSNSKNNHDIQGEPKFEFTDQSTLFKASEQQHRAQQQLSLFPQLCSSILDSFHLAQTNKIQNDELLARTPGVIAQSIPLMNETSNPPNDQINVDEQQQIVNLASFNNIVMDLRANNDNKTTNGISVQRSSSPYGDRRELIKALILQQNQTNAQLPNNLITDLTKSHIIVQSEQNSNLNAFYALLSSIDGNLYQQPLAVPKKTSNNENMTLEVNRLSNLQQTYQHLLTSQPQDQHTLTDGSLDMNFLLSARHTNDQDQNLNSSLDSKNASPNSLLVRSKTATNSYKNGNGLEMFENNYKNDCQLSERSREKHNASGRTIFLDSESIQAIKRDSKFNRMFKRSADSILDSNNSSLEKSPDMSNKRIKIDVDSEERDSEQIVEKIVNKYAKNLVTQVALARDIRVDVNVIREASRFTERFVETLFDTAQVIARHSNGASSTDAMLVNDNCSTDKDSKDDKEIGRSNINLNDLTSALKLLPSKLLKILK